jgi:site-specific DNA-methyltransferase (adenine-specific)
MNKLYFGDNLEILREYIDDESVDLIYLDPPFNSDARYNVLFQSPKDACLLTNCGRYFNVEIARL